MPVAQPASIKVHKTSGTTMEITWKDGHQSTYPFTYLRDACPCATCNGERDKAHREPGQPADPAASGPLQMFKPQLRPTEVAQVGNYAREWCPCDECRTARHAADGLEQDIDNHPPRVQ
jgi:DUF971 family protein